MPHHRHQVRGIVPPLIEAAASPKVNLATSTGVGSTRLRQDRRKGGHPPLIGHFTEASPSRSPSQGPGRVPFGRKIGNSRMTAELKTGSIRPPTPSMKPNLMVNNTDLRPNRPTTTPSLIVTPAVSAASRPNCLILLTCVAVSAGSVAGGGR
jgi:hypothetical protein